MQVSRKRLQVSRKSLPSVCKYLANVCKCLASLSQVSASVCKCLARVSQVSASVCKCLQISRKCLQVSRKCLQVSRKSLKASRKCLAIVPQVSRKALASVSQMSRKCLPQMRGSQVTRKCLPSVLLCTRTGPICTHLPRAQNPSQSTDTPTPQALTGEHADRQRCRFHTMCYALHIRTTHHSAAPALGNTMDHTSRIRVLCIKRRKPAGEGYLLRITYPYYISSAVSPPERAICTTHYIPVLCIKRRKPARESMEYALRIRIIYQAPNHNTRRTQHTLSLIHI